MLKAYGVPKEDYPDCDCGKWTSEEFDFTVPDGIGEVRYGDKVIWKK
jgi:hypothetical protein